MPVWMQIGETLKHKKQAEAQEARKKI
jgi:hypothetical protein